MTSNSGETNSQNDFSNFGISNTHKIFIYGESKSLEHLRSLLTGLPYLVAKTSVDMPAEISNYCFMVYVVDFSNMKEVQEMATEFESRSSHSIHKILYVKYPPALDQKQLLLASELGVRFSAAGNNKDTLFKDYLKDFCAGMTQLDSLEYFEEQMQQYVKKSDAVGIETIIGKVKKIPVSALSLKIIANGYRSLNKFELFEQSLKRLLSLNKQDLWAATELGKLYLRGGQISKGVEVLEKLSHFHNQNSERLLTLGNAYVNAGMEAQAEKPLLEGNKLTEGSDKRFQNGLAKIELSKGNIANALAMVGERGFSEDVISYLNMKAIICLRKEEFEEGIEFYQQALQGAKLNAIKTKIYFNMGLAFARNGNLERAKGSLSESMRLGGGKFKRAEGPLEIIFKIQKNNMDFAQGVDDDVMEDLEFETIS